MSYNLEYFRSQTAENKALLGLGAFVLAAGALSLISTVFTITKALLSIFVVSGKPLSSFGPKGSWAVVTGASDGIGKQYAFQIAAKGFNLILASRTRSKLTALASEISTKYPGTKVETVAIDFSAPTETDYSNLDKLLNGKQISILINNVGQSHSIPVTFNETELKEMTDIINVNCLATLRVTKLVLPEMIKHKKGLILTMGSFGGLTPTPLLATYSGSKAFLQYWSNALAAEVAPKGITVHFVQAWLVTSAMSKIRRTNWQIPSEKSFVQAALAKIGCQGGSIGYAYSGSPYWSHALAAVYMLARYGALNKSLAEWNRDMHLKIRDRALKKALREAQKGKKDS